MTEREGYRPTSLSSPQGEVRAPKLEASGHLNWTTLNALSQDGFAEWLEQRLSGHDHEVPIDERAGELPYALFVSVFQRLAAPARERLIAATIDQLRALAAGAVNDTAHAAQLLMLSAEMLPLANEASRTAAMSLLQRTYERLEREPDSDAPVPLALRTLQTLVSLQWHAPPAFWQGLEKRWARRIVPLAFEAQCVHAPEAAFEWLATRDWNHPEPAAALDVLLPTLLERYGRPRVEAWASDLLMPGLRPAACHRAESVLSRNDIRVDRAPPSGVRPPQVDPIHELECMRLPTPAQIELRSISLSPRHDERLREAKQLAEDVRAKVDQHKRAALRKRGYASLRQASERDKASDHLEFSLIDPGVNFALTSEAWFWYLLGSGVTIHGNQCLIITVELLRRREVPPSDSLRIVRGRIENTRPVPSVSHA